MDPWSGVRDALTMGATAQRGDVGVTLIPEPSVAGDSTLNVNVFTPDPSASLPVLVFIHGGAFISGSPASEWYDGRAFNRDGVVTVSVGYRLGFDGFGHIEGAPANRGVRDWIAALEWVQRNIAAFGGDPSRVTIAGQSAGGGGVLTLLSIPGAQHLFAQAMSISGVLADVPIARAEKLAAKIADRLGVSPTLAGFSGVAEDQLLTAQRKAAGVGGHLSLINEGLRFGPEVDGDLITQDVVSSIADGTGRDKALLLGSADNEFTMTAVAASKALRFIPLRALFRLLNVPGSVRADYLAANAEAAKRGNAAALSSLISDKIFRGVVLKVDRARAAATAAAAAAASAANSHANQAASTWTYRFAYPSKRFRDAIHCIDVPFWFDCLDHPAVENLTGANPPQSLADEVHSRAVRFVKTGDPGWTAWNVETGSAAVFGKDSTDFSEQRQRTRASLPCSERR